MGPIRAARRTAAALLFVAASAAAQGSSTETRRMTPEQHSGQLGELRLKMMYPALAREPEAEGEGLDAFVRSLDPVLRNLDGLCAYLAEGLRDPRAAEADSPRWERAWVLLEAERAKLKVLVERGEALEKDADPGATSARPSKRGYRPLDDGPQFSGPYGERLSRAVVLSQYAGNLREYLVRRAVAARAGAGAALP